MVQAASGFLNRIAASRDGGNDLRVVQFSMERSSATVVEILGRPCEIIRAQFQAQRFDRHFHDTFSIGVVTSGVNAFSYRGARVEVPVGSICIADPGEIHDGGLAGAPWSYVDIFLPQDVLRTLLREEGSESEPAFPAGVIDEPGACAAMAAFLRAADHAGEDVDELAVLALGRLVRRHAVNRPPPTPDVRPPRIARRAVEMIRDLGGRDTSLSDLARETNASRFRVIRAVSQTVGLAPVAYMIQLRVEHAKRLIRDGTPIAEAALEAGFADQSHLTRAMKRRWGVTPGTLKPR